MWTGWPVVLDVGGGVELAGLDELGVGEPDELADVPVFGSPFVVWELVHALRASPVTTTAAKSAARRRPDV